MRLVLYKRKQEKEGDVILTLLGKSKEPKPRKASERIPEAEDASEWLT